MMEEVAQSYEAVHHVLAFFWRNHVALETPAAIHGLSPVAGRPRPRLAGEAGIEPATSNVLVPAAGFEPARFRLQGGCSTD